MTETQAKAKAGKRVRTLDTSSPVAPGTTGTAVNPRPMRRHVGRLAGTRRSTQAMESEEWLIDVVFDDPAHTVDALYAWNEKALQVIEE